MNYKHFGPNVRHLRKHRGFTIDDLVKYSGISKGHISEIENGKTNCTVVAALRIAEALGTTIQLLLIKGTK